MNLLANNLPMATDTTPGSQAITNTTNPDHEEEQEHQIALWQHRCDQLEALHQQHKFDLHTTPVHTPTATPTSNAQQPWIEPDASQGLFNTA